MHVLQANEWKSLIATIHIDDISVKTSHEIMYKSLKKVLLDFFPMKDLG